MMNTLKKVAILISLACALVPGVGMSQTPDERQAQVPPDQQATKEQLAKLFEVMRLHQQFDNMMKVMPQMAEQQMRAQMKEMLAATPDAKKLTPEQQAALDKLMSKYLEKAQSIYPINEMLDDAASVYQRYMSRSDVDAYIAFYNSPPGQHLLDAQPLILKEYMPLAMKRVQERSAKLSAEMAVDMQEFMREQAKASGQSGPASGTPSTDKPAAK